MGARVPKTEFLRLFAPESTANTPHTHYNTLLAPHRSVVLPVSSLAAFGKSPAARGSRNGPRTTAKTEVSSRNGTWTQLGGTSVMRGHLAGWCWCVGVGGGLGNRWGVTGVVGATSGEFLRLWSRSRNGTWTELGGTSVGRGVPSWLVLVCGGWRGVGKSVGSHWGR